MDMQREILASRRRQGREYILYEKERLTWKCKEKYLPQEEDKAGSIFCEETVIFWRLLKVPQKAGAACL